MINPHKETEDALTAQGFQIVKPTSSTVILLAYQPVQRELCVKFNYGIYSYADVPPELWEDLQSAPSAGKFLHAHVKGKFNHERKE